MLASSTTPAPGVGDRVIPKSRRRWRGQPVPSVAHTVILVHDCRPDAFPDCLLVLHETGPHNEMLADGWGLRPTGGMVLDLSEVNPA